jgi:hypothetical protein
MSAHCRCEEHEREPVTKEVSPSHFDGESYITECRNCGGLISA